MSNLENVLHIDKQTDIPIGLRFFADLIMIADKLKRERVDVSYRQIIDGLMICYAKSSNPRAIRRRQKGPRNSRSLTGSPQQTDPEFDEVHF